MHIMPIRVAIIEDNVPFAQMFQQHFAGPDEAVLCTAVYSTAEDALAGIPADPPEVVMVDINLPGMSGTECIARLRESCPQTACIVLTTFEEDTVIFEALKAGACGYLLKRSSPDELVDAVKQAISGGAPMSPQVARQVVGFFHQKPPVRSEVALSPRELEIIDLLAGGLLYKEIAERLDLSFETIRSYVKKIYEKLHVHSRTEAVLKWRGKKAEFPWIRPPPGDHEWFGNGPRLTRSKCSQTITHSSRWLSTSSFSTTMPWSGRLCSRFSVMVALVRIVSPMKTGLGKRSFS